MEYMHLVGAESVQNAASTMRQAASEMQQAASSMSHAVGFEMVRALENHQQFMNDWLERFAGALARASAPERSEAS